MNVIFTFTLSWEPTPKARAGAETCPRPHSGPESPLWWRRRAAPRWCCCTGQRPRPAWQRLFRGCRRRRCGGVGTKEAATGARRPGGLRGPLQCGDVASLQRAPRSSAGGAGRARSACAVPCHPPCRTPRRCASSWQQRRLGKPPPATRQPGYL